MVRKLPINIFEKKKRLSQNISEPANQHVTPYSSENVYYCFGKLLIETLWDKRKPEIESQSYYETLGPIHQTRFPMV